MKNFISASLLAVALFIVTFAVNLQAPLYNIYAVGSGVGVTAVTLAFAAYVAGLMPTLMLLGGLSDRIGRRIPVAAALLFGFMATFLLVVFPVWEALVLARFMLGVGTGFATTAGTAYMTEILGEAKAKQAALLVTSATSLGFGGGALATGISLNLQGATIAPASFIALFILASTLSIFVLFLPRVDVPKRVSLLRLPVFPPRTWPYGIGLALAWSTTGMTIAVVPLQLEAQGFAAYTGVVIFLSIFIGFLCQPVARRMKGQAALLVGYALVPTGFLALVGGFWSQSILLILAGTCITSSASYGFTYLCGLSEFSLRAPEDRARATAGLFVYAYVGFSFPVITSGALADMFGLLPAMGLFLVFLFAISLFAVGVWRFQTQPDPRI
ncbi:MAG: MFS transporter [Hyphomicrobiales bacterium]|nr:MFS transporter [Hyphomicrobiales bacterium]MCY4033448.1 MFS transporter [Hyphomicrobiales bacterium]MCY4039456.1 MFS transporter [Hyphomicrobiales bacterium]